MYRNSTLHVAYEKYVRYVNVICKCKKISIYEMHKEQHRKTCSNANNAIIKKSFYTQPTASSNSFKMFISFHSTKWTQNYQNEASYQWYTLKRALNYSSNDANRKLSANKCRKTFGLPLNAWKNRKSSKALHHALWTLQTRIDNTTSSYIGHSEMGMK